MSKRQDIRKLKEEQEYILKKLDTYILSVSNLTDDVTKLQTPVKYIKGDKVTNDRYVGKHNVIVLGLDTEAKGYQHRYFVEWEDGMITSEMEYNLHKAK
jgi:hypothetical protein